MISVVTSMSTGVAVVVMVRAIRMRHRAGVHEAAGRSSPSAVAWSRRVLPAVGTAVGAFVLLDAWLHLWVVAAPPALLAGAVPGAITARRRRLERRAIQRAWPDALRDVVASLRAGRTIESAFRALARTGPRPLRDRMDGLGDRVSAIGFVPALEEFAAGLDDPTSDRVIEVLVVAADRGGSIVPELLAELAGSLTKDAWMAEEIETDSLEHRINAWAVFALPWIVLAVLTARGGPFREFYASTGGMLVVLAAGLASGGGMAWVLALGRTAPEPRVFRRTDR